jgi:glucan 1,3-beta-glucosidase
MAQATSIQNCKFLMDPKETSSQQAIFMESGSGGFLGDLTTTGGNTSMALGNQQYTMRNIHIDGANVAIQQLWNWGWTYKDLKISNCGVGIEMSKGQDTGSVTLIDSQFTNVMTAIKTSRNPLNHTGRGSLVVDNVDFVNVPTVLANTKDEPLLLGTANGPVRAQGNTIVCFQSSDDHSKC